MSLSTYRWTLFILVGFPFQLVVFLVYLFIWTYWRLFHYENYKDKLEPVHKQSFTDEEYFLATDLDDDTDCLRNDDDHGAFTQYGVGPGALRSLVAPEGDLFRTPAGSLNHVSGDVVVAWAFAYSLLFPDQRKALAPLAQKVAWNYLKHLGTRSIGKDGAFVSTRCNNFGINYSPDSEAFGVGQPAAGPQFYTSSAIFAVASEHSKAMKFVFWAHWLLMGGWFWAFAPVLTPRGKLSYVKDITMKALWAHYEVFGKRWWIRSPMEAIVETTPVKNALFEAMIGRELMPMPSVVHAFFSQEDRASSNQELFDANKRINASIKGEVISIFLKAIKPR